MPGLKWIVYAGGAALVATFAFSSGNARKTFFTVMVLALQADVTLMLVDATGKSSVGSSGPDALLVPLAVICALTYLGAHLLAAGMEGQPVRWFCGSLTIPGTLLLLTTAATVLWSPEIRPVAFGLQDPLYGYVLAIAAINFIRTRDDVARVLTLLLVVLGTQSVVYFIQNATGFTFSLTGDVFQNHYTTDGLQRHGGTVGTNPKGFAMFMAVLTLIALATFLTSRNRRQGRWSALLTLMGIGAIVLTLTRATWVGVALGSLVIVWFGARRGRITPARVIGTVAVVVIPVLVLIPSILLRLSNDVGVDYDERATLMQIAWRVITAHPLGGVGAGAYGLVLRDYVSVSEWGKWLYIVHNAYLLRWAETGILGLLSLVLLLAVGIRIAFRCMASSDDAIFALGLGGLAALLHLSWEMWWDIQLGGTTPLLFWFLLGALQAASVVDARHRTATVPVRRIASYRRRQAIA
jgi:O-antigen ligase